MAGNRKFRGEIFMSNFVTFLVLCWLSGSVYSLQCMSQQNKPIDWYIAYKLPDAHNLPSNSFYFMDAVSKVWSLSMRTLNDDSQAIYNTLQQIYTKSRNEYSEDLLYLMYNDDFPSTTLNYTSRRLYSTEHGHTKGVIAFDSNSGFWLIHSTPKFPPSKDNGYSYPDSAKNHGQSFLCISMDTSSNLDEIGHQLLYNYPGIYDQGVSSYFKQYSNMMDVLNDEHITTQPWYRETILTSLSGVKFRSFAKYANFDKDLYSDWLAPLFQDNLLVETWQNGRNKMCSNCSGTYKVYNINTLEFDSDNIAFKETQDHSKWMVTNTTRNVWTCIGDINRQMSQEKRPGGTVCLQDIYVWKQFHQLITSYHDCNIYSGCIPP
ncbi:deoxyribonuclease II [Mactra antiquata]